jgi:hypothetical protein
MNRMKQKTERIMKAESDRESQKDIRRKTFAAFAKRPNPVGTNVG